MVRNDFPQVKSDEDRTEIVDLCAHAHTMPETGPFRQPAEPCYLSPSLLPFQSGVQRSARCYRASRNSCCLHTGFQAGRRNGKFHEKATSMPVRLTAFIIILAASAGRCAAQDQDDKSPVVMVNASVVFFGPTKSEGDSISRSEGMDIADMLDEFDYASGKAAVYLSSKKIPYRFTTSQSIFVKLTNGKVRRFDRKAIPDLVGMILTDGIREPRLVSGSAEDKALIHQINDFFRIPEPPEE